MTTSGTSEGGWRADASARSIGGWLDAGSARQRTPQNYLRRHGGLVILIGRFIATVRVLVWPIASAHGIGYGRFLAWDLGAAALWAGAFVLSGYAFGRPALTLMKGLGGPAFIAAGVGVSVVGGGMLVWRRRRRRKPTPNRRTPTPRRRRSS